MDFLDNCQTASVIAQTITTSAPVYQIDLFKTVATIPAFTDNVDTAKPAYYKGICGEKLVTIDASSATSDFLTLVKDPVDPINIPLKLEYS